MDILSIIMGLILIIVILKEIYMFFKEHINIIIVYIENVINLFFETIYKYPKIKYIIYFTLILYFIKIISNKTLVRQNSYKNFFLTIIYFCIFIVILILLVYNEESINYLQNNLAPSINNYLSKYQYNNTISFDKILNETNLIIFLMLYILIWLNNRLLWIISIFIVQLFLSYMLYQNGLVSYLNKFPKDYSGILTTITQLVIIAPYALFIWIFRDNDRYKDYEIKYKEIYIKEKEIDLRKQELQNKNKELALREKELKLIEEQNAIDKKNNRETGL